MVIRTFITGLSLALLVACAGNSHRSAAPAAVSGPQPAEALTRADVYYHLILAEIAGQRNHLDISVKHLLQASRSVSEPLIAERATRVAYFAKDYDAAFTAAQRWVEVDSDSSEALQSAAALALHEGKTDEAFQYLQRILQLEEDGLQHGFQVVAGLLGQGRDKHDTRVLDVMAQIVAAHPDNAYAHLAFGDLAMLLGHLPVAEKALNKALSIEPDLPAAIVSHARTVYQQGRVDEALAHLRLAISDIEDKQSGEALRLAYGRMLLEVKRYEQAREQFTILSEAAPEDSDYLYTLSLLALDMEEAEQAETHLKRLIELGERVPEAYYYLGRIAESQKNFDAAIRQYERVGRSEYQFDAQIRVGQMLARSGQIEAGLAHLRSLRMRNPESSIAVRLYLAESAVLTDAKRYQDAIDLLSDALSAVPGNTDLLYSRSLLYEKTDRIDLLEQDLRAVLLREPENADALNALGYTLADRTTRYEEAYDLIMQALKLKPDEAAIIDSMGWVLYRLGRAEEAVTYLKRALNLQYDNEIAGHLSEVLWVVGQRTAAQKLLENALEKSPGDETLLQVKEQLDAGQIEP